MRAIAIRPEDAPQVVDVEDSLGALQKFVGGLIETVSLDDETDGIVNEEGLLIGLPLNAVASALARDAGAAEGIAGPMLVVGVDTRTGEFRDVSERWIKYVVP